jgi:hypothetical protein
MKRISLVTIMALFVVIEAISQNVDDALRYSQISYSGTARFMSLGGAFTALGGDLSTLSQNPAGIGVFRSSELAITPQLFHINTTTYFNNGMTEDHLDNFNLNQGGIVMSVFTDDKKEGLLKLNLGYSFNKTSNLNQSFIINGISNTSSMADSWAGISEGAYYGDLAGPEGIAYDAWIIDTITGSGGTSYGTVFSNYGDNPPSIYGQNVRRYISYEGYTGEHAVSFGGNYSNKIFFGVTMGFNVLRYYSHYEHVESTDSDMPSAFQDFSYVDHYENHGNGYTVKGGLIIKPVDAVRIGVAFHSPTWYNIDEYFYESISSRFTDGGRFESDNEPLRYNYALATPYRVLAGVAVQIRKMALLSADYEFVDYTNAHFSETGDNYDYSEKNTNIKNTLQSVSNFRVGGELRFDNLYLRTGYGYYGKPFKQGEDNADLDYSSISAGAGFREKNVFIDFGYTNIKDQQTYFLYPLDNTFDPASATIKTTRNMYTLTFGFRFGI